MKSLKGRRSHDASFCLLVLYTLWLFKLLFIDTMNKKVYRGKKGIRSTYSFAKKPKITSKRRLLNRFDMESQPESVGTSAKKLKQSEKTYKEIDVDQTFGYRLINFVFSTISQAVVCKRCKSDVTFTEASKRGLGFKIIISCTNCEQTVIPNSPYIGKGYEINRRIIFAMRLLGIGLNGIIKFCAFMELPRPIFQSFYDKLIRTISISTEAVCEKSMKTAAKKEKEKSIENGQTNGLTISGDGTWRKRGFSSLFGLVSVIGWYTGKVIDIVVKSKYCKACEFWNKDANTEKYADWAVTHENECQANHKGSAGKMEVDAVIDIFQRSEELHGVKYVYYIGDGDSKTFRGIIDAQPYENCTVTKKECIDHVQKKDGYEASQHKENYDRSWRKGQINRQVNRRTLYLLRLGHPSKPRFY